MGGEISHGEILSATGVNSSVAGVYSDVIPQGDGADHQLFLDVTLNDVTTLELWPEITLDGVSWKKMYACDKTQILHTFTSDFSGALVGGHEDGNAAMSTLPVLGAAFRWGVKPTVTATTGADIDLSLEGFDGASQRGG